ncbi:hypothetical protein [Azospirillum brasilense]
MAKYVVAVKREFQSRGVTVDAVRQIPGVQVKGGANDRRAIIEATPEAAGELRRKLGDQFIVEAEILHHR